MDTNRPQLADPGKHARGRRSLELIKTMVDAWFTDLMATTTAEQRRARCARAAQQRANTPTINLAGLGDNDVVHRRAKCERS